MLSDKYGYHGGLHPLLRSPDKWRLICGARFREGRQTRPQDSFHLRPESWVRAQGERSECPGRGRVSWGQESCRCSVDSRGWRDCPDTEWLIIERITCIAGTWSTLAEICACAYKGQSLCLWFSLKLHVIVARWKGCSVKNWRDSWHWGCEVAARKQLTWWA